MRRALLLALPASLAAPVAVVAPAPADAFQLAGLVLGKFDPVQGQYRKGNVIRASAVFQRDHSPEDAYRAAMMKIGEMANAKGYARVGVTKVADCGRVMRNRSPTSVVACRILAQMVGPDEVAKPEGDAKIVYFRVADLVAGLVRPEGS
jgi:hypothetical protein